MADITPAPLGAAGSTVGPSAAGLLGFWGKAVPTGVLLAQIKAADGIGAEIKLPEVPAPNPIEFPPIPSSAKPLPGQATAAPVMPPSCPNNFFGDPTTRTSRATGTKISAAEVAKRRKLVEFAIDKSKTSRPLSSGNFKYWLDGTGIAKVMPASLFQTQESRVPALLSGSIRPAFEKGIKARLDDASHPQGTLKPSTSTVGSVGPVRFIQFRDGVKGGATIVNLAAGNPITDLDTAVGSFQVHSAVWVQAKITEVKSGLFGTTIVYEVSFLRWCVQIYDFYDWNHKAGTPFPLSQAEFNEFRQKVPQDIDGVSTIGTAVIVQDHVFGDMEASGTGKAYLIRSDAFEAPLNVRGAFKVSI